MCRGQACRAHTRSHTRTWDAATGHGRLHTWLLQSPRPTYGHDPRAAPHLPGVIEEGEGGAFNLSGLTWGGLQRAEAVGTHPRHAPWLWAASKFLLAGATAGPGGDQLVGEWIRNFGWRPQVTAGE